MTCEQNLILIQAVNIEHSRSRQAGNITAPVLQVKNTSVRSREMNFFQMTKTVNVRDETRTQVSGPWSPPHTCAMVSSPPGGSSVVPEDTAIDLACQGLSPSSSSYLLCAFEQINSSCCACFLICKK